jgi:hypothetical protein
MRIDAEFCTLTLTLSRKIMRARGHKGRPSYHLSRACGGSPRGQAGRGRSASHEVIRAPGEGVQR